jgi:RNA polymerase sigma-70 factor (ECF subfamily)
VPSRAALDAFCEAFNARDIDRLTSLLLDTAVIQVVGSHNDYGPAQARKGALQGMLFGSPRIASAAEIGGMDARFVQGVLPDFPRAEVRVHRGEAIVLSWFMHEDGEHVRAVTRAEVEGDRITRLRNYFFTPDSLAEISGELGVSFRSNGYRYWAKGSRERG